MRGPGLSTGPVGVAIRSDRRLYRDVLAAWLADQPGFTVVGQVAAGADLLELCRLRGPDLVLFDAVAGVDPSLALLRELRTRACRTRLVVVYEDLSPAERAAAGRIGVERLVPCSHGLPALRAVLREYVPPLAGPGGAGRASGPGGADRAYGPGLTEPERAVLRLVAAGEPVHRIAALLGTSGYAVEHRKRRIYAKLRAVNQSHAIARAAALGIGDPPARPGRPPGGTGPGPPLVVLRGPPGPARQRVAAALAAQQVGYAVDESGQPAATDRWAQRHPGPRFLVLVDPRPQDWDGVDRVPVPVLWVCPGPLPPQQARAALERGVAGVLSTELVALLGAGAGTGTGWSELTVRESQILRSIAAGDTVRQTARWLGITEKTVQNTQARLFRKFGCRNRAATLARAIDLGLLEGSRPACP